MHKDYKTARSNFIQEYDSSITFCYNENCTDKVTEYYFSSGVTMPLCTYHVTNSSVVFDDGIPVSKQYYDQVYYIE